MIAVVMAIAAVAFTPAKTKKQAKPETPYFWYTYDAGTDKLTSLVNNPSDEKIEKHSVVTDCEDDDGQPDCMRGYSDYQPVDEEGPEAGEDQIRITEEP